MIDGVDIDRAHATPGTSRALADIAHDFERTLLQLRAHLDELLQATAEISSAASSVPAAKILRAFRAPGAPRSHAQTFLYQGERLTIRQLAKLADCSYLAMHSRLKHNSPEEAVAMGKADRFANWRGGVGTKADPAQGRARVVEFMGKQCSIQELATYAGCTYAAMHARLKTCTPADAVAMGPNGPQGVRRRGTAAPAVEPAPSPALAPTPAPLPRPSVFEHRTPPAPPPIQTSTRVVPRIDDFRPEALAAGSKLDVLKRGELQASDAEPVIPPDVKRTVAPPVPDRYAVAASVDRPFSSRRIGEYDDDRTHIATVYGGKAG